jgi:hypothetical protein
MVDPTKVRIVCEQSKDSTPERYGVKTMFFGEPHQVFARDPAGGLLTLMQELASYFTG